ncbi:hypothetical protein KI387_001326, partial [Taxus chinensis]
DLHLMSRTDEQILLASKVFDEAKSNLSRPWVFSVEWKIKVLEEALGELKNMWQKGEAFKACVMYSFQDIHFQIQNEAS